MNKIKLSLLPIIFATSLVSCSSPTKVEEYFLSFESNGGTHIATQRIKAGEKAIKPIDPIKDDYTFAGWFTTSDFKEDSYFGFETPIYEDITLFAKWNLDQGYSQYSKVTTYKGNELSQEADVFWDHSHIVKEEGFYFNKENKDAYKEEYQYDVDEDLLLKHISTYKGDITTYSYEYDTHHNITREEMERMGVKTFIDYQYTYDKTGNILTLKKMYGVSTEKDYEYVSNEAFTYDDLSRLLTSRLEATYKSGNTYKVDTSYEYQDSFMCFINKTETSYEDEIKTSEVKITNTLDEFGNPYISIEESFDLNVTSLNYKRKTFTYFDKNNIEISHEIFDMDDKGNEYPLIETYEISYLNNHYDLPKLELLTNYNEGVASTYFKRYNYDKNLRLISLDDTLSGKRNKATHYVYSY